jgi:hypothetical protein
MFAPVPLVRVRSRMRNDETVDTVSLMATLAPMSHTVVSLNLQQKGGYKIDIMVASFR